MNLFFEYIGRRRFAFVNKGLNALYKNATKITDTTALANVVIALNFAKTLANSCGCPKTYCL